MVEENEEAYTDNDEVPPYTTWLDQKIYENDIRESDLAERSGVSYPTIRNIRLGKIRNPQNKTRVKLEHVLGTPEPSVIKESVDSETIGRWGTLWGFDPHASRQDLPDSRGVYVFYDSTGRPVYVGSVTAGGRTIADRVSEHYQKFWFKRPIVEQGAYIPIEDADLCHNIERILIKFLGDNALLNKKNSETRT